MDRCRSSVFQTRSSPTVDGPEWVLIGSDRSVDGEDDGSAARRGDARLVEAPAAAGWGEDPGLVGAVWSEKGLVLGRRLGRSALMHSLTHSTTTQFVAFETRTKKTFRRRSPAPKTPRLCTTWLTLILHPNQLGHTRRVSTVL